MNIQELVEKYLSERDDCLKSAYNETQLRNDFIDPLLKCFGWDVDNEKRRTQFLRDVIQEEYIEVDDSDSKKNPDYTLRINGTRKLFVEVKKPSIDVLKSSKAAFQTRRYGWNANLGISILTNFEFLIIYDCRLKPDSKEDEHVARVKVYNVKEYIEAFKDIEQFLSFENANNGLIDKLFSIYERKGVSFDEYFLSQIENWRIKLAFSALENNVNLKSEDVNFLIQRLLNRIIFLRICEDRTIEKYETLKGIKNYNELKLLFEHSDKKFNSGLFDFIEDTLSLDIHIDNKTLIEIFNELYYPLSPFDFSVVDPSILSQIYERFLGSKVIFDDQDKIVVLNEPEVTASNGVVPTPKLIVERIVKDTLSPIMDNISFNSISKLKIVDICCGSGTFLISAFDFLLEKTLEILISEESKNPELYYQEDESTYSLSLKAKRDILENNIFGVDINPYAVEVTEFSLLLKLLERENKTSVEGFFTHFKDKLLPSLKGNIKCGNSLIDSKFYNFQPDAIEDNDLLYRIKPFDWETEFPFIAETGGFDAIIGNPPYVRIQNMMKYASEEIIYYQSDFSGFSVAKKDTIDKYYIFIQKAISLLNNRGFLGYIVPHKFFLLKGGESLREFITSNCQISKITHFGVAQVFPDRSTYTAILVLKKTREEFIKFKRIKSISPKTISDDRGYLDYDSKKYNSAPWVFLSPETEQVFNKFQGTRFVPLKDLAEICVGLQTSADNIYIFTPETETSNTYKFIKQEKLWEIEKGICQPAIYRLSFSLFDSIEQNAQLIFPYFVQGDKAEVLSESTLARDFPLAWRYLLYNQEPLRKRSLQGDNPTWYQFGRSQSLTKFQNTDKLIWSVLKTSPPYTIDRNNLLFTGGGNGPYYALINDSSYSLFYFLGILSHPVIEYMVKSGASEFRGAYYSHGKQFLEKLPIRLIDFENASEKKLYEQIVKDVKNLIDTNKLFNDGTYGSKRNVLRRKMQTLNRLLIDSINRLYEISTEEFGVVMKEDIYNVDTDE
jgi:hypothetical protein